MHASRSTGINVKWRGFRPLHFFLLTLALFTIYSLGISGLPILDDWLLSDLRAVEEGGLKDFIQFAFQGPDVTQRRPLSMLAFALQAKALGPDLAAIRAVNILIHLLNAFLLYRAALAVGRRCEFDESTAIKFAWFSSIIWAAMAVHATTVLYPIQRMTLLATTCSLGVFAGVLRSGVKSSLWTIPLWIAGVLFKEIAILALPTAYLVRGMTSADVRSRTRTYQSLFIISSAFIGACIAYNIDIDNVLNYSQRDFSSLERLMLAPTFVAKYGIQAIIPTPMDFSFYYDDVFVVSDRPLSWVFISTLTFAPLLFLGLGAASKRWPAFSAGVATFVLLHAGEGTIWPLELYFEHRNYAPTLGIALALSTLVVKLKLTHRAAINVLAIWVVWSGGNLAYRAHTIGNETKLVRHHLLTHPQSYRSARDAYARGIPLSQNLISKFPYDIELIALSMRERCGRYDTNFGKALPGTMPSIVPMRSVTLQTFAGCKKPCAIPEEYVLTINNRYFSIDSGRVFRNYKHSMDIYLLNREINGCDI